MGHENKSNVGDWLFLALCLSVVVGYFAYENATTVTTWIQGAQAMTVAQNSVADSGLLSWIAGNWGLLVLVGAVLAWGVKSHLSKRGTVSVDGGPVIAYSTYKYLKVKLIN